MPLRLACESQDIDALTGECANPYWADDAGFPTLSISDAYEIGVAIAWLWAVAYGYRVLKRWLR